MVRAKVPAGVAPGVHAARFAGLAEKDSPAYGAFWQWSFAVLTPQGDETVTGASSAELRGKARDWAEALLARPLEVHEELDFDTLLGRTCQVAVEIDGKGYSKVTRVYQAAVAPQPIQAQPPGQFQVQAPDLPDHGAAAGRPAVLMVVYLAEQVAHVLAATFAPRLDAYNAWRGGHYVAVREPLTADVVLAEVRQHRPVGAYFPAPGDVSHVGAIDLDRPDGLDLAHRIGLALWGHGIRGLHRAVQGRPRPRLGHGSRPARHRLALRLPGRPGRGRRRDRPCRPRRATPGVRPARRPGPGAAAGDDAPPDHRPMVPLADPRDGRALGAELGHGPAGHGRRRPGGDQRPGRALPAARAGPAASDPGTDRLHRRLQRERRRVRRPGRRLPRAPGRPRSVGPLSLPRRSQPVAVDQPRRRPRLVPQPDVRPEQRWPGRRCLAPGRARR